MVYAISRQLILARTLKAEKLSIESLVMGIAEHRTHARALDALRAALTFRNDEIFVRTTFDLWTLGLSAAIFASMTFA